MEGDLRSFFPSFFFRCPAVLTVEEGNKMSTFPCSSCDLSFCESNPGPSLSCKERGLSAR